MSFNSTVEILLIEDRNEDVELTMRALRKHNLANNVEVVNDGAKALECIFSTGDYAGREMSSALKLILLDLKLPKVDGLEILQRIRADKRTHLIPVVVLTSSAEERDIIESYKLGVNSYIVKPMNFGSFVDAVSEVGLYWLLLNQPPVIKSV